MRQLNKHSGSNKKSTLKVVLFIIILILAGAWAVYTMAITPATNKDTVKSTAESSKTAKPAPQAAKDVKLYYVALEDNGKTGQKIGCNDSLVEVDSKSGATSNSTMGALEALLSNHDEYYGQSGLYNALHLSWLTVVSAGLSGDGKTMVVDITGSLSLGGDCDGQRVMSQIEQTARSASGAENIKITINGKPINEAINL
ncbi:MAG: GerMN domain-containing protein [Candidatus Saccharimonas sp.]